MIAVALKTENENGVLAPLFGKAKFFAIVDDAGSITVYQNKLEGGMKVAQWIQKLGVSTVIANHLGEKPFHALKRASISIFFAGTERITLGEVLAKMKEGELEEVNTANYARLLGEEEDAHAKKSHCCGHKQEHHASTLNALSKRDSVQSCQHFHL
jgi:predicted Fe-Mo cluster-binding NifX family protein